MITFQCPNGHSLSCPSDRAGRKARCPKCEAEVTVPEATDQVEKTGSSLSGLDSDDSIAFLCPNGHKLNGPAAMQGKPGQCPHCKERFIIPDYEEPEELDEFADSRLSLSDVGGFDDLVAGSSLSTGGSMATSSSGTSSAGPFDAGFSMQQHFEWLWSQRGNGIEELEVHLSDGNMFTPDYYFESSSSDECGVFATEEHMDAFELNIIRWESISRILVRNLTELPGELG